MRLKEEKKEISAEAGEGSEEVAVEGREGKEADGELIEAEESREVVTGQSRGDTALRCRSHSLGASRRARRWT